MEGMTRTWEQQMALDNSPKTSWPSFTYSLVENMGRENMAKNVSEAKEQTSYREIKAIATWYLKQRTEKGPTLSKAVDALQALEHMKTVAEEKRKENAEKRKRKAEEDKENDAPKKVRRSKKLRIPSEQIEHQNAKIKRDMTSRKNIHQIRQDKSQNEMTRAIAFAFYPSKELHQGLMRWLDIADQIDLHVKEVVERFASSGEKASFEYIRDQHICLSKKHHADLQKKGTLHLLEGWEKRQRYISMPIDMQQALVMESNAGCSSAQTNYERGNNKGYELGEKDGARRFRTLKSLATGLCVDRDTGTVTISPRSDFVSKTADRGVYLKDRLIHYLCDRVETKNGMVSYMPTKKWGNDLVVGKTRGGRGFTLRFDSVFRRWSLILATNVWQKGSPFRPEIISSLLTDLRKTTIRARRWILRTDALFSRDLSTGNLCSIDPGVRTPWTCYDAHSRRCYNVYPDMVGTLTRIYDEISLLQQKQAIPNPCTKIHVKRKRKKKRERKKAEGRRKKKLCHRRRSLAKQITHKHDQITSIVRQAHNAFANHLVRNYDTIVLPEFMTKNMVRKRRQKMQLPPIRENDQINGPREGAFTLRKTTRKAMSSISHFKFRQRILSKALADPNKVKHINITTEEYSTKQCPFCDFIHHKIGGKKVFKCEASACGFVGDRDCVGAFNIKLRAITKNEIAAVI